MRQNKFEKFEFIRYMIENSIQLSKFSLDECSVTCNWHGMLFV